MALKKGSKLYQIGMIVFLVLLVLGFALPGFLNLGGEPASYVPPRLCQADADCYLLCGEAQDTPVEVLCLSNLCQQNGCEETSPYPYQKEPVPFTLTLENISADSGNLPGNLFVLRNGGQVQTFTPGLSLSQILQKLNASWEEKALAMWLNGGNSSYFGGYVPQENDSITILLSE